MRPASTPTPPVSSRPLRERTGAWLRGALWWGVSAAVAAGGEPAEVQGRLDASVHSALACADCHEEGAPATRAAGEVAPGRVDCRSCHENLEKKHAFHPEFAVAPASTPGPTACAACHGSHEIAPAKRALTGAAGAVACGRCHEEAARPFGLSAHGRSLAAGRAEAPSCLSCHTGGGRAGGDAVAAKLAQSQLCLSCHLSDPRVVARSALGAHFIEGYGQSVHGAALTRGNAAAANCVDCHGSHEMNRAFVADSRTNPQHVAETCARCHPQAARDYGASVHAAALAKGSTDSPVCTDCHGEHRILVHTDPRASVAARNVSQLVCGSCHASVKLNQRYGLAADRFRTFADSYHGLATRGGSTEAVNCASCHGAHAIRPSHDPMSTVAKGNLVRTCGQCHPGANDRFAVGAVHVDERSPADPLVYWVATVYVWLIVVLVGGMAGHNLLDFVKKVRTKIAVQKGEVAEPVLPHRLHLRMTVNERLQHGALVVSFATLVVTGFMLRYPEAWWVVAIRGWSDQIFAWRGLLHRAAGVALVAAGLWHGLYLLATPRGRRLFRDLLPRGDDLRDMAAVLRFNLGLSREKPQLGRFSYHEKIEYWALLWGSAIMGLTGAVLWFENTFIGLLTKHAYDVARTVHFYEAVLATLAIVVWHFYFVIFNPDVYPMNLSWLTGRLSEKEMAEGHGRELAELKAARRDAAETATGAEDDVSPRSRTGGANG